MSPFITFRDRNKTGQLGYYVLQRDFPHIVGLVSERPPEGSMGFSTLPEYNLWVVFDGTLRGNMIPGYRDITKEVQAVLDNMAAWFWAERIVPEEKKFKRFKVSKNDTTVT